jgi:hypothetical protein
MLSFIFRLDGQRSRNPVHVQTEGRCGQTAVTNSRGLGNPAVESHVEVSDDVTE